jgi:hypothetical protein
MVIVFCWVAAEPELPPALSLPPPAKIRLPPSIKIRIKEILFIPNPPKTI